MRWRLVLAVVAIIVGGCVAEDVAPPVAVPASADIDGAVDWFVERVNDEDLTSDDYEERFAQIFRDQVSFELSLQPVLRQLEATGPYVVVDRLSGEAVTSSLLQGEDGFQLALRASIDPDGRFETLTVQSVEFTGLANPPESPQEAWTLLEDLGEVGAIAGDITDGRCEPISGVAQDTAVPVGSVIKVAVLAMVAQDVEAGVLDWEDQLTVTAEAKSIPTGVFQERPSGSTTTVREAAELMIAISDNTAFDLLVDLIGRDQVSARLESLGITTVNDPFLLTRELAALKLDEDLGARYLDADSAGRRAILDDLPDFDEELLTSWTAPRTVDTLEWFATPRELCDLAAVIDELRTRPGLETVDVALRVNPGVPTSDEGWQSVAFKGGSEPGLISTWWLVSDGDTTRFVGGSVWDGDSLIPSERSILAWAAARDVLVPSDGD